MRINLAFAAAVALLAGAACADGRVWLDELSLNDMMCGWKNPRKNKSVEGGGLQIGSKKYERGVGTHAESIAMMEQLAVEVSDTRLNVSRTLNSMQQRGLIELHRGRIVIPMLERLFM